MFWGFDYISLFLSDSSDRGCGPWFDSSPLVLHPLGTCAPNAPINSLHPCVTSSCPESRSHTARSWGEDPSPGAPRYSPTEDLSGGCWYCFRGLAFISLWGKQNQNHLIPWWQSSGMEFILLCSFYPRLIFFRLSTCPVDFIVPFTIWNPFLPVIFHAFSPSWDTLPSVMSWTIDSWTIDSCFSGPSLFPW